jgi:hypothetical protein
MNDLSNKDIRQGWRDCYHLGIRIAAILLVLLIAMDSLTLAAMASPSISPLAQQKDSDASTLCAWLGLLAIVAGLILRFTYGSFAPSYTQEVTSKLPVNQVWAQVDSVFPKRDVIGRPWARKKPKEDPPSLELSAYPLPYWSGCLIMLLTGIILGFIAWVLMGRIEKVTVKSVEDGEGSQVRIDARGYAAVSRAKELVARLSTQAEAVPPATVPSKKVAPTLGRSLRPLDDFARAACKSTTSISVQMSEIEGLIDALKDSLEKEYPALDPLEVFHHAQGGLVLRCPNCGQLTEQAVTMLYLGGSGIMQQAIFLGPNVAALARGRCPGCGGSAVKATFDPAKIKARNAALLSPDAEAKELPVLKSMTSYPYQSSLTVSPDEEKVAWVCGGKSGAFEIVIASTTANAELARFTHPAHKSPPKCFFVGSDRLLVSTHLTDEGQVHLTLFDAQNGRKAAEIDVPDCRFHNPCARHNTKTIVAQKDWSNLLVLEMESDDLMYKTIGTGQIDSPGPRFGPDGELYVISGSALYRVEGDDKVRVMDGSHCFCFDPAGKIYCGGGYSDRSGTSALWVADLNSGSTFDIPWGQEPIEVIEWAGDNRLLVANKVDETYAARYPNVIVTLFSVAEWEKKWTIEIADLKPERNPVLLSEPREGWALIQTGKLLKRTSLQDGNAVCIIQKQLPELIGAEWLPSKRLMYLSRNPDRDSAGMLECYRME